MSFVVDTNVLVYATNQDCDEHDRCRQLLQDWRSSAEPFHLTWSIAYEFLRVVTHPRVLPTPWRSAEAWQFIAALSRSPGFAFLAPDHRHARLAEKVFSELVGISGNLVHDAQIAVTMREHGVRRIFTRDTAFHRFPFIEPIDPMAP